MISVRLLGGIFLLVITAALHGQSTPPAREQKVFNENNPILRPVPLPPGALNALLQRKEVRDNLREMVDTDRKNVAQLFTAAEIHLSAPNQADLVVMGEFPMSGGDNDWFWVIRSARKGPSVVLFAGAYSLELLATRTNGYRDIRSTWSSPQETSARTYKFDGKTYKLWRENRQKSLIGSEALGQNSASKEQIAFLSEDSFPPSAPISQTVLKILLKERLVRESMERASDAEKRNPVQLFRAAEVHLFDPNEVDLLIVGNVPIAGADNGWFWVVRSAHKNPRVVLSATGYMLELLRSRTNGYRDIRCTWSNPNVTEMQVFKFNHTRYKLWKDKWEERN